MRRSADAPLRRQTLDAMVVLEFRNVLRCVLRLSQVFVTQALKPFSFVISAISCGQLIFDCDFATLFFEVTKSPVFGLLVKKTYLTKRLPTPVSTNVYRGIVLKIFCKPCNVQFQPFVLARLSQLEAIFNYF